MAALPPELLPYLSATGQQLAQRGLAIMATSHDPYHDHTHAGRMLQDFAFMLRTEPAVKQRLDPEVVVLSICWHDTWKAGRVGRSIWQLLLHQFWDGMGSMALFDRAARQHQYPRHLRQQIRYAIRKHAQFQVLPLWTLEAVVLRDLDDLDLWSIERLERGKGIFAFTARWRVRLFRRSLIQSKMSTEWAMRLHGQRAQPFLDFFDALFG